MLSAVSAHEIGNASGVVNTCQRLRSAFGVAVVSAVFVAHGNLGTFARIDAGFRPALAVAAAFSLLGAASALAVTPRSARALSTENEIARARLGGGGTPIAGTAGG